GKPKGVLVPHRALASHGLAMRKQYRLQLGDRVLQFASLSFDVAAEELFPTWLSGATVVLRSEQRAPVLADFEHLVEQAGLTVVNLPTYYWHAWVAELSRSGRSLLPPALRLVIVGSEAASPERLQSWQNLVGGQVRWCHAYGVTETTITTTLYGPASDRADLRTHVVPI